MKYEIVNLNESFKIYSPSGEYLEILSQFLYGNTVSTAHQIVLEEIQKVLEGKEPIYEYTFDAHNFVIKPDISTIENYDIEDGKTDSLETYQLYSILQEVKRLKENI